MVVLTFNPSTGAEAGGNRWVQGQPDLQYEFQGSQGYIEKPYLKKPREQIQ